VRFAVDAEARQLLAEPRQPAYFEIGCPDYEHAGSLLAEEVRQSLLEDLELSDRDEAVLA
jgi:hypothetical protein